MKKSFWYVIILIAILIVAVVLCVSRLRQETSHPAVEETPAAATDSVSPGYSAPVQPEQTPEQSPEVTEEPVFVTKEPITAPEPTPDTSPQVTVPPVVDASGSFSSDSGTNLNTLVEWTAVSRSDGNVDLTVNVSATSFSFNTSALYNAITITVNGESRSMNSPEVNYDGDSFAITPLASASFSVPTGSSSIEVVWNYKGSYGGTELEQISASGTAYLG